MTSRTRKQEKFHTSRRDGTRSPHARQRDNQRRQARRVKWSVR